MCIAGCTPREEQGEAAKKQPTTPAKKTKEDCPLASQDPIIKNVSGPTDQGCGGNEWKVWFELPEPAKEDGWVIQEIEYTIDVKNPDGSTKQKKTYHFWEAWKVEKGKKVTVWQDKNLDDNDDAYTNPSYPGTKGAHKTTGKAKFFEGPLPPDFKKNNPNTVAGILHSSTQKPPFWDGSGTDHSMTNTWDCTGKTKSSKLTTTP